MTKLKCLVNGHNWTIWYESVLSKNEISPMDKYLQRHCKKCNKIEYKDMIQRGSV